MKGVSVIIPTFNRRDCVTVAVASALEQTRPPDDIVVVDDGSTDGTYESLLRKFGSDIVIIRQDNRGVSAARNAGVMAARGDLIAFLDSDDVWLPEKLERQLPLMSRPGVVLSVTDWILAGDPASAFLRRYGAEGLPQLLEEPLFWISSFKPCGFWLPTWIVRKTALLEVGGFDERLRIGEDIRLLFDLAFVGAFAVTPYVGTERSAVSDENQLTVGDSAAYLRQSSEIMAGILTDICGRASNRPVVVRRQLRQLLAYFLVSQAKQVGLAGGVHRARQLALAALVQPPRVREAAIAGAILVYPRLMQGKGWLNRRSGA